MHRRELLTAGVALTFAAEWPTLARADVNFDPTPGTWRNFQVTTRLEIAWPTGISQAWIPLPSVNEKDWIKSSDSQWTTNGKTVLARDPHYGAEMLHVAWAASEQGQVVEVTSRIATRDRAVDLTKPGRPGIDLVAAERKFNTAGTGGIPGGGLVKQGPGKITPRHA